MSKITLNNIKSFFQGNYRMFIDSLGDKQNKYFKLEKHLKEQVLYRASLCQECKEEGECKVCGCSVPGKWFADKSCGGPWGDMLNADDWEKFKQINKIDISINDIHNNK